MRNKSLMKVVHKIIYLIRRSPFNRVLYDFINKDSTVLRVYNKLMKKSGQREYFSTEAKEKLVNLLKKDIKKLDNIVDFDLSLWLKL